MIIIVAIMYQHMPVTTGLKFSGVSNGINQDGISVISCVNDSLGEIR